MSLQTLIDKDAIAQVYVRYCEIVDAKTFDAMHEVFTEDATGDYTQALGPGVISPDRASLIASMHANPGPHSNCWPTHQQGVERSPLAIAQSLGPPHSGQRARSEGPVGRGAAPVSRSGRAAMSPSDA